MGILCARCNFLQGMYPFGIAFLMVAYASKNFFYIFSGTLIGAITISFVPKEILINTLPYALALPFLMVLKNKKEDRLLYSMLLAFLVFLVPAASLKTDIYVRTVLVFDGLIALCLVPIIKRLYRSYNEINSRLSLEQADILALCFIGAMAISSLPKMDPYSYNWYFLPLSKLRILRSVSDIPPLRYEFSIILKRSLFAFSKSNSLFL